jgi:hypothetical protein
MGSCNSCMTTTLKYPKADEHAVNKEIRRKSGTRNAFMSFVHLIDSYLNILGKLTRALRSILIADIDIRSVYLPSMTRFRVM